MLDFEALRMIWWVVLGVLFIGFSLTDGWDFGAAILYPFVTRNELERRVVLSAITPFWEGNQVWIILGAGATFAAFPFVYAVAFSGPYFAVLLLLLTMGISRPVAFKYREKVPNVRWQRFWDAIIFIGGLVPALVFGVLVGNLLTGLPYYLDQDLRINYNGSFLQLFNPFSLWCGLTSVFMVAMHGGLYVAIKTDPPVRLRLIRGARLAAFLLIVFFAIGGLWVNYLLRGYQVASAINHYAPSNPLHKNVISNVGDWMLNYKNFPVTILAPVLGFIGAFLSILTASLGNGRIAFFWSSIAVVGIITTVGVSMFPFLLPSSTNLTSSLLIWDASSSQLTLLIMLISVIIFMPIVLLYTFWVYHALRGKVTIDMVKLKKT